MLRWGFADCGRGFRSEAGEELRGHHLCRALNHSLAHTGNRSSHLNIGRITDLRARLRGFKVQVAHPFEESRLAFAIDDNAQVFRRSQVFQPRRAVEYSFYRSDSGSDRRGENIVGGLLEALTTRDTALQDLRIDEALIDPPSRRVELVGTFQFHFALALAAWIARRACTCAR